MIERITAWVYAKPYRTWVGHGLVGFFTGGLCHLLGFNDPTAAFTMAFFYGAREIPGIVTSIRPLDSKKFQDGSLDLISPFVGIILWDIGVQLLSQ